MSIVAVSELSFAVGDQVKVHGDDLDEAPWTITKIVTDDPMHDGPFARLIDADGKKSWAALRILGFPEKCPAWCEGHVFGEVHISPDRVIATSAGPERGEVYVSVEQEQDLPAAVRLSGAADRPMTPAQALELAQALTAAAFAAVTR